MALDALAVPTMSDKCERLFSSTKILLNDHWSWLRIDIIEASECLWAWYGPPTCRMFDDETVGLMEGEPPAAQDEDTQDTWDSSDTYENAEVEDEPQIPDLEEKIAAGADQNTSAAAEGDNEIYCI